MEEREETNNTGFGLKQLGGAPDGYLMDPPRPENPNPFPGPPSSAATSAAAAAAVVVTAAENAAPPFSLTMPAENSSSDLKKKRGRPRKYNPDGTLAVTLSPMPISSSVPLSAEFSPRKRGRGRGRGRSSSRWLKKSQMFEFDNPDSGVRSTVAPSVRSADFLGANFTPHVLTVNAGEDVTMKLMTFSQQGSRAICILSATGPVSNVTLRQPMTSGGTLTYEGRFEILSLTGSFMPSESGGTRSRAGGMSVSLSGPDGRVFGGGLAGLFIAAGPVQVVVGSFIVGQEQQPHQKKQKRQRLDIPPTATPASISFSSAPESRAGYERLEPVIPAPPVSFSHENPGLTNANAVHNYYTNSANHVKDLFSTLPEEEEGEEEEEGDDDEEEAGEEEYGGESQSDTEVPS